MCPWSGWVTWAICSIASTGGREGGSIACAKEGLRQRIAALNGSPVAQSPAGSTRIRAHQPCGKVFTVFMSNTCEFPASSARTPCCFGDKRLVNPQAEVFLTKRRPPHQIHPSPCHRTFLLLSTHLSQAETLSKCRCFRCQSERLLLRTATVARIHESKRLVSSSCYY